LNYYLFLQLIIDKFIPGKRNQLVFKQYLQFIVESSKTLTMSLTPRKNLFLLHKPMCCCMHLQLRNGEAVFF